MVADKVNSGYHALRTIVLFSNLKVYLFIYLFYGLAVVGLCYCTGTFSSGELGLLLVVCVGFSLQ